MNAAELLRASLRAIKAHTLRSFLTLLGVIIGVATIVAVVGVISGLNTYVKEKIIVLAPDVFIIEKFGIIRSRQEFLQAVKRPPSPGPSTSASPAASSSTPASSALRRARPCP